MMISFMSTFMQAMNTRLNERDDLFLLEACSIFNPADREVNKTQRKAYTNRLLQAFPHDEPNAIHNESAAWMKQSSYNKEAGIVNHFAAFAKGSEPELQKFGKWALNVLKNLPSNALVESRFSTAAQAKSSFRMNIGGTRLAGTIMMRDEQPFEEVHFTELMEEMLKSSDIKTSLKEIRGKRSRRSYGHSEAFQQKKKQKT